MASKRQVFVAETTVLLFIYYKNSAHAFFVDPYSGYIATNSAGQKGCELLVLSS